MVDVGVILAGFALGVVDVPGIDELLVSILCLTIGLALTFAFRSEPGEFCRRWQAWRKAGPAFVFRGYAHAGPWLWRFGIGVLIGVLLRGAWQPVM